VLKVLTDKIKELEAKIENLERNNAQQGSKLVGEITEEGVDELQEGKTENENKSVVVQEDKKNLEEQIEELKTTLVDKIDGLEEIIKKNNKLEAENDNLRKKVKELKQDLGKKQNESESHQLFLSELGILPEQLTDEELKKLVNSIIELIKLKDEKIRIIIKILEKEDNIEK
jgi:hypothetical protein